MNDKYDVIICDVYNIFYRWNFNEKEKIINIDGKETHVEGIIAFIKAVNTYLKKFAHENSNIYMCFDNAETLYERHDISDKYKMSRKKRQPKSWFYRELDYIELILKYYDSRINVIRVPQYEADDYAKNIIEYFCGSEDKVLMISEDEDWCRWLSDNVHQYMNHEIYNRDKFIEENHYEPTENNIAFYKSFYGDDSDDIIPAFSNFPKQYFYEIINEYDNMKDFVDDVKNKKLGLDLGWVKKAEENEQDLLVNYSLVKSADISYNDMVSYINKSKYQENKLRIIYSSLGILGEIDERIKPNMKKSDIFDMFDGEHLER